MGSCGVWVLEDGPAPRGQAPGRPRQEVQGGPRLGRPPGAVLGRPQQASAPWPLSRCGGRFLQPLGMEGGGTGVGGGPWGGRGRPGSAALPPTRPPARPHLLSGSKASTRRSPCPTPGGQRGPCTGDRSARHHRPVRGPGPAALPAPGASSVGPTDGETRCGEQVGPPTPPRVPAAWGHRRGQRLENARVGTALCALT